MYLFSNVDKQLKKISNEAGGGIEIRFEQKGPYVEPTRLDDSNPYWLAFKKAVDTL